MAKKGIWTTLAGLAVAGAAVGGAVAYLKKCKDIQKLSEDDFEDLDYLDEEPASCGCSMERTYTTLPPEPSRTETDTDADESQDSDTDAAESMEKTSEDETTEE